MTENILIKSEVKEYLESAKLYCEFMESNVEIDSIEFLKETRQLLLTLYQKGLYFPLHDGDSDEETNDLLGDDYFAVLKLIGKKVGKTDFYLHIYDPTNSIDEKAVGGSLTDDFGDIYRDIKRALLQLDTDSEVAKEDALWSLHFLFRNHYSEHIINGLYAIHFFLQHE
jgi:Domain of unknown function (DUF5063)